VSLFMAAQVLAHQPSAAMQLLLGPAAESCCAAAPPHLAVHGCASGGLAVAGGGILPGDLLVARVVQGVAAAGLECAGALGSLHTTGVQRHSLPADRGDSTRRLQPPTAKVEACPNPHCHGPTTCRVRPARRWSWWGREGRPAHQPRRRRRPRSTLQSRHLQGVTRRSLVSRACACRGESGHSSRQDRGLGRNAIY